MGTISTVTIGTDIFSVYALTADPVADSTSFHNGRLGAGPTAFAAATTDNKARALVAASDWVDRAVGSKLSGEKTVSTQPRAFPRDGATCAGEAIADGTTPDEVVFAAFFLAGEILVDPSIVTGTGQGSNIKQAKAGSASVTFFRPTIATSTDTRLPIAAMDYLKCLFAAGASGAGVATGVSSSSAFCPSDFQRSEGYS